MTEANINEEKGCKLILDETQKIMDLLEQRMEEISRLEKSIRKNEKDYKNLEISVITVKTTINLNYANFENRTDLKEHIDEMNKNFFASAQSIYAIIETLNNATDSEMSKFNNEKIEEKEQKLNIMVEKVKQSENKLMTAIEERSKVNLEMEDKRMSLIEENKNLKLELENLKSEIKQMEEKLSPLTSESDEILLRNEVSALKVDCEKIDNEISEMISLRASQEQMLTEKGITPKNITESHKQISQLQDELEEAMSSLEKSMLEQKKSVKVLFELESKLNDAKSELEKLRTNEDIDEIQHIENRFVQEMLSYDEALSKQEARLKLNENLDIELSQKMEIGKNEIKFIESDIELLDMSIKQLQEKSKEDVYPLVKLNEEILQELTLKHNILKEEHFVCLTKKQEQFQTLIKDLETDNQNKDKFIKTVDNEITDIVKQIIELGEERINIENELKELETFRAPKPVKARTANVAATVAKAPSTKVRRWDSDTSIESADSTPYNHFMNKAHTLSKK